MTVARTARRRRKQMAMNNAHLSGLGVSRYKLPPTQQKFSYGSGRKKGKK